MHTVTASEVKQNSMILQDALRSDLLITKHDKPFVVVMDYQKYQLIEHLINKVANDTTLQAIARLENDEDIQTFESADTLFDELDI